MSNVIYPRTIAMGISAKVGVQIDPPQDKPATTDGDTSINDFVIPSEAVYVRVKNLGGLNPAIITINGSISLTPGSDFERTIMTDGVNRYLLPQYSIVTNGSLVEYYFETA